jgi:hypothetical protein
MTGNQLRYKRSGRCSSGILQLLILHLSLVILGTQLSSCVGNVAFESEEMGATTAPLDMGPRFDAQVHDIGRFQIDVPPPGATPDASTDDVSPTTPDMPGTSTEPDLATAQHEPRVGSASRFDSVVEFLAYLKQGRSGFDDHIRYKGMAWEGEMHSDATFPIWFTHSSRLQAIAQTEAQRLVEGGDFRGAQVRGEGSSIGGQYLPFWVEGINTAHWMISFREGDYTRNDWHDFPLNWGNIPAKFAFHYHDFGGDGPVIRMLGVGAAALGKDTFWVMRFGS